MADLNYEFVKDFGEIGQKNVRGVSCSMKLCREKWNNYETWAVRCFFPDGKYTKGLTFTTGQLKTLKDLLAGLELEDEQ